MVCGVQADPPEPHHDNHELLSVRISITVSSVEQVMEDVCEMLILEILTLNLIFLLTTPATRTYFTSSGNTIKLITRNILVYNKHT